MTKSRIISVIDDDVSLRLALVSLLKSLGYRASAHESAEAFLASDQSDQAECIVSDIHMAGMSGIDLKDAMVERGSSVPVILITARQEVALLERANACGAACLLRKPFDADHLLLCLKQALGD